jgi:uncharacterized protein
MVTVVLDTNVLISALLGHGKPRRLVSKLFARHVIVTSRQMLAELRDVLSREKFLNVSTSQADEFLVLLVSRTLLVTVRQPPKIVPEDPDDDIVLATAREAQAEYLVSGDKHLLKLQEFKGIRIVTVNEMLEILRHKAKS